MYQKPDFVKVSLDIKDNFAAYTGCHMDEGIIYTQALGSMCHDTIQEAHPLAEVNPASCWIGNTSL